MGRLNKRQQRELAELEELERSRSATIEQLPTADDVDDSDDEQEQVSIPPPKAGFGAVRWLGSFSFEGVYADLCYPLHQLDLGDEPEEAESASEKDEAVSTPAKVRRGRQVCSAH